MEKAKLPAEEGEHLGPTRNEPTPSKAKSALAKESTHVKMTKKRKRGGESLGGAEKATNPVGGGGHLRKQELPIRTGYFGRSPILLSSNRQKGKKSTDKSARGERQIQNGCERTSFNRKKANLQLFWATPCGGYKKEVSGVQTTRKGPSKGLRSKGRRKKRGRKKPFENHGSIRITSKNPHLTSYVRCRKP